MFDWLSAAGVLLCSIVKAELLSREGARIGSNDLMIASIAQANHLAVVTRNCDEFVRVPGLRVESW